jgi:hypothetical protein
LAASAVRKGVAASPPDKRSDARPAKRDPIAAARANWERAGWGDVSQGMVAVTSVMRAHQILLARVETALRPYDLSFSRFELLRLLAFSRSGALPITKASDRLQVHVTSVTHAIRRLEADGLVQRVAHPTDRRTTLVDHRPRPLHGRRRHRHAQRAGVRRHRNGCWRIAGPGVIDRRIAAQRRGLLIQLPRSASITALKSLSAWSAANFA